MPTRKIVFSKFTGDISDSELTSLPPEMISKLGLEKRLSKIKKHALETQGDKDSYHRLSLMEPETRKKLNLEKEFSELKKKVLGNNYDEESNDSGYTYYDEDYSQINKLLSDNGLEVSRTSIKEEYTRICEIFLQNRRSIGPESLYKHPFRDLLPSLNLQHLLSKIIDYYEKKGYSSDSTSESEEEFSHSDQVSSKEESKQPSIKPSVAVLQKTSVTTPLKHNARVASEIYEPNRTNDKRVLKKSKALNSQNNFKSRYTRNSPSGIEKRKFLESTGDHYEYDSSDEEEIRKENQDYNLYNINFIKIGQVLNIHKTKVIKSFLLHTIGRMVIYSPTIDKLYRQHKKKHLSTPDKILSRDGKISTQLLDIQVSNIEDIIALGRLLRRSQVRLYKTIHGYDETKDVAVDVTIRSGKREVTTTSVVHEDLVASYSGLGKSKGFPSTDMVNLRGESGNGDYKSAYKNNNHNYAKEGIKQFIAAGSEVEQLKEQILIIEKLKNDIIKHYPKTNGDVFIAESIRKVCRSEPLLNITDQEIRDRIYALTYLLFKTEFFRSPAALVNHVQMLDLIVNGEMTLKEAFEGNKMPMSSKNVIKAARDLEKIYDEQSFYKYKNPFKYAPQKDKSKKEGYEFAILASEEAKLMDKWLIFRFGEKKFKKIDSNIEKYLPDICHEIYGALRGFGFGVDSLSTFYNVTEQLTHQLSSSKAPSSKLSPLRADHLPPQAEIRQDLQQLNSRSHSETVVGVRIVTEYKVEKVSSVIAPLPSILPADQPSTELQPEFTVDNQHLDTKAVVNLFKKFGFTENNIISKVTVDIEGEVFIGNEIYDARTLKKSIDNALLQNNANKKLILFKVNSVSHNFAESQPQNNHYVALYYKMTSTGIELNYLDPTGNAIDPEIEKIVKSASQLINVNIRNMQLALQFTDNEVQGEANIIGGNDYDCGILLPFATYMMEKGRDKIGLNEIESKRLGQLLRQAIKENKSLNDIIQIVSADQEVNINGLYVEEEKNSSEVVVKEKSFMHRDIQSLKNTESSAVPHTSSGTLSSNDQSRSLFYVDEVRKDSPSTSPLNRGSQATSLKAPEDQLQR